MPDHNIIELSNYPKQQLFAQAHEKRGREKRERKYRQLLEREAMKFSHSVQFNAVPEWSSHYINYSNLKKLSVVTISANCGWGPVDKSKR